MAKKVEKKVSKFSKFCSRFLVCVVLVLIGLICLKSSPSLREKLYKGVFQNNLNFAKINEVYKKYFGSSLPLIDDMPESVELASSSKIEYTDQVKYKDGVKLTVNTDYVVSAIKGGIVIFAGEKEGYGNTIIIQQSDGIEVWYSNLKEIKVNMYDYLKQGDIIGQANGEKLFLVFTKEGKPLDYQKYI